MQLTCKVNDQLLAEFSETISCEVTLATNTELRIINLSDTPRSQNIIILQKNFANNAANDSVTVWRVISGLKYDHHCEVSFSNKLFASISDSYNNHKPIVELKHGYLYKIMQRHSQVVFVEAGLAANPLEIQIENSLTQGAYNVNIFRNNSLLSHYGPLIPKQKIAFQFKYIIWVGFLATVKEGDTLFISDIEMDSNFQQFYLIGIKRADLVLVGGGIDHESTPLKFHLINIEMF